MFIRREKDNKFNYIFWRW